MNELKCQKLIGFKDEILPLLKNIEFQVQAISDRIFDQYVRIVEEGSSTKEERDFLADLRHHNTLLAYSLTHQIDELQTVGSQKTVERYYNFVDGEAVEVDKAHFAGLPDGAEVSTTFGRSELS